MLCARRSGRGDGRLLESGRGARIAGATLVAWCALAGALPGGARALQASAVAAGANHTCALTTQGGVWCWGYNAYGELGNGTTLPSDVPVPVSGLSSGVAAISAGGGHSCALTGSGGVLCWGLDTEGQLGDGGGTTQSSVPVPVSGLSSGVAAIAAGGNHTCALTTGGAVLCWGFNGYGQLGDANNPTNSTVPAPVVGLSSGVDAIAAGRFHSCAVTASGGALCWGSSSYGQVGADVAPYIPIPQAVTGLSSGVASISAGGHHTCALTTGGGALCWGSNAEGQLGDGTMTTTYVPQAVSGLASGVTAIAAGFEHTCASTPPAGAVACWGANARGQLGYGSTTPSNVPVAVSGPVLGADPVTAGLDHSCAKNGAGIQCWGDNADGELGDGDASGSPVTTPVPVTQFFAGAVPALSSPLAALLAATIVLASAVTGWRRRRCRAG